MRLEHWASAAEHGAIAARNAVAPGRAVPARIWPYFLSGRFVAIYRDHDRVVSALAVARPW
jgi:hypothetical protein